MPSITASTGTIDVNAIVTQLMAIEQQPITKLDTKISAVQEKIQTTTADLQAQESKLTAQIVDLIKEAASKVAKKEKYDIVIESSNVLFGGEDVTASVIKELNAK